MTVTLRQALTEGFAPLLRADRPPLVKHEGGRGHDQQSHGNWARGIAKIPDTVGSFSRMSTEDMVGLFPTGAIDSGQLVWHDPSTNSYIVAPPPLDDRSGIDELAGWRQKAARARPSSADIAKAVRTIARLQEAAPVRNLSVSLMHEVVGEYEDTGPNSAWGQSRTMMAFAADERLRTRIVEHPNPDGNYGRDSGVKHVIEVSFDRIEKGDFQYEYMRKNPLEYILAHEWAHAISFDRHGQQMWADFKEPLGLTALDRGFVERHHAPLEVSAVRGMESALEAATGDDVKVKHIVGHNAKRHQVTRAEAEAVGWSAYGMSDYSEAYAEAFAAWALGASDTVPEMTTWGLDNFDWESWVTLQDGTVVPVEKAAGDIAGIGCTFDPAVGPVWLTAEGKVEKHGEHDQSTHGSWADGRRREEGGRPRKVTRIGSQEMMDLADRLGAYVDMERVPHVIASLFPQQYDDAIEAWWSDKRTMLMSDPQRVIDLNEQFGTVYAIRHGDWAYQEEIGGETPLTVESFSELTERSKKRIVNDLISRMSDETNRQEWANAVIEGLSDYEWDRFGGRLVDRVDAKKMAQNAVSSGMESVPLERLVKAAYSLQGEIAFSDDSIRSRSEHGEEMRRIMVAMRDGDDIPVAITVGNHIRVGDDAQQALDENLVRSYGGILSDPDIQSRLSKRLRDDMSYGLIKAWAETSNKTPIAATIQQAAAEEFGIADAAAPPSGTPLVNEDIRGVARAFVRAQYEATQKMLAEQFPDTTHFVLFRGGDGDGRFDDTSTTGDDWRESTLTSRPMASFSTSMGEAEEFMDRFGKLFAAAVPRERILSTPFTGNGAVIESEFVVLGGPMRGRRADSFDVDTPFDFDPDDLPMGETEFIMIDGQPVPIGKARLAKHEGGMGHEQSSHGNWARGMRGPVSVGGEPVSDIVKMSRAAGVDLPETQEQLAYALMETNLTFRGAAMAQVGSMLHLQKMAIERGEQPSMTLDEVMGQEAAEAFRRANEGVSDEDLFTVAHEFTRRFRLDTQQPDGESPIVVGASEAERALMRYAGNQYFADDMDNKDAGVRFNRYMEMLISSPSYRIKAKRAATSKVAMGISDERVADAIMYVGSFLSNDAYRHAENVRGEDNLNGYERASEAWNHGGTIEGREVQFRIRPVRVALSDEPRYIVEAGDGFSEGDGEVGTLSDPEFRARVSEVMRYEASRVLIDEWSSTSNRSSAARVIQAAAAAEFGLKAEEDESSLPLGERTGADVPAVPSSDLAREFVRAQYRATQKMLAEQFPNRTHFVLHRGGDSERRYDESGRVYAAMREEGAEPIARGVTLNMRPLASFSLSRSTALMFGNFNGSFTAAVPRERILSTPFTGNGALFEEEAVVLGGPIAGTFAMLGQDVDPADLPVGATEFITVDGVPIPIGKAATVDGQQETSDG